MVGLRNFSCLILGFVSAVAMATSPTAPVALPVKAAHSPKAEKSAATAKPTAAPKSDILFEGYSKILLGTTHIGYTIQRFEFNPGTKEYSTTYYLKTQPPANDVIESLKARSTADLQPLSYQYTELASGKVHIVDATFKNGTMTVSSLQNGKRTNLPAKKIAPGTFLASFLGYLMLQQKQGVKVGNKYSYQAIAEEDGNVYKGEAYVKSEETVKGISSFKILNTYKNVQFISYFTPKGEILATDSAAQGISTELVATIQEATKGMSVNSNQLTQLFGAVPKGQDNAISRKSGGEPLGAAPVGGAMTVSTPAPEEIKRTGSPKQKVLEGETVKEPSKTEGIPGGSGIMIKGKQTPEPSEPAN